MKRKVTFIGVADEMEINSRTAPEFLLLYQQAVLLALKEQGILDERQLRLCLEALTRQRPLVPKVDSIYREDIRQ